MSSILCLTTVSAPKPCLFFIFPFPELTHLLYSLESDWISLYTPPFLILQLPSTFPHLTVTISTFLILQLPSPSHLAVSLPLSSSYSYPIPFPHLTVTLPFSSSYSYPPPFPHLTVTLSPFLILQLPSPFSSSSGRR